MNTPENEILTEKIEYLLKEFSTWSNTTTVVIHGQCVFEFKGRFPEGQFGHGYYNLKSEGKGLEGHLRLDAIKQVTLQTKPHRGRNSYAFVFRDVDNQPIFKVFLGRDTSGEVINEQLIAFERLKNELQLIEMD